MQTSSLLLRFVTSPARRSAPLLASLLAVVWGLGCNEPERAPYFDPGADKSDISSGTGSLGLSLLLSDLANVAVVEVEITGEGHAPANLRTIPIAPDDATVSAQFGGLAPGTYAVELSATSADGETTCSGSATFAIVTDETVGVVVPLTCKGPNDTGEVIIDVDLNVCPSLEFFFIAPLTAPVGSYIYVEAAFVDPNGDTISYDWSAPEGHFDDSASALTTYHCDEPGVQTLTLRTNDGGDCELSTNLQVACVLTSFSACEPGEFQTVAPTQLEDRQCAPCPEGTFSTIQNAANCVPWTACPAGEFISTPGSTVGNLECTTCPEGTFSSDEDATECALWQPCAWGEIEMGPGTATHDTECSPGGEAFRQFGTSGADGVNAIATSADGSVYVAGVTQGALGGSAFGSYDAFVRKYAWTGEVLWTQQFGTTGAEYAYALTIAADGTVYIAGNTTGSLEEANIGLTDAFLRKYDADGVLIWARQFGTTNHDYGYGVAVDATGAVVIAGATQGGLEGANLGGPDGYVRKYDANGGLLWTRQYGTTSFEYPGGVGVDIAGNVYVAGGTSGALAGSSFGSQDGYVRKYSSAGDSLWTAQFGTSGMETVHGPSVDANGRVYVAGGTTGALEGSNAGTTDAFVRAFDASGAHLFTDQFGTTGYDIANGLAVGPSSGVYVAGISTGALDGGSSGGTDAFVRRYSSSGSLAWGEQYGTSSSDTAIAAALDGSSSVFTGGSTDGALVGTSAGGTDAYVFKLP